MSVVSQALLEETIAIRRDLHAHPELSFAEVRTAALVAERLRAFGLEVRESIGKTGVVGVLSGARPGPTIMLRADMDALPMLEESEVSYRSKNAGVAHACGHDAHVAMLLGAAQILKERAPEVHGRIAFVFQPGEEVGGGAEGMLRDGLMQRFGITRAYGLHVLTALAGTGTKALPSNAFGVRPGSLMAGSDSFDLVIDGRGGHGAAPHLSVDPIAIAAEVVTALQRIVSRETDPVEPAVLSIGAIAGGTTYNVIPPRVSLEGDIRSFNETTRAHMQQRIFEIAQHVCAAAGAQCSIDWLPPCPATVNDPVEAAFVKETLTERFGSSRVVESPLVTGSEDFSYFLNVVPGCFYFLGAFDERRPFPYHHPAFDIDESAMSAGIEAHVAIALAAGARS
jgi:amidohydrolase